MIALLNNTLDSLFIGEYEINDTNMIFLAAEFAQKIEKFEGILVFPTYSNYFLFSNKYKKVIDLTANKEIALYDLLSKTFNNSSIIIQDIKQKDNQLYVVYGIENTFYYCCWVINSDGNYHLQQNQKLTIDDNIKNMKSRIFFSNDFDLIYIYNNSLRILRRVVYKI